MEQESAPAQQPAPPVQQPVRIAQPQAPAVVAAHGNAAVARMAAGPGAPMSPSAVQALAPHAGNAAIARMLDGPRAVARDPAAAAPAAATPAPTGAPPKLALPGGIPLQLPSGPGQVASTGVDRTIKALDKKFGVNVPLGPLQGKIGGTLVGLARYSGGFGLRWDRPAAAVSDPLAVKDTISLTNGTLGATGSVAGGIYGSIGLGNQLASASIGASGTIKATAAGALTANGAITRDGANGQWTGGIDWGIKAEGTLTAAATGYFEWNLLWLEGRREIFRLESFPLATITVRLGGKLKPDGTVSTPTREFDLVLGTPPPAKPVGGAPAPAGGQPAKVAPKRRADAPPDDPRPGANVLARQPDEQPDGAQPAPAGAPPAAAPDAPREAQPQRSPEAIAGDAPGGDAVSNLVPSEHPEGVEP